MYIKFIWKKTREAVLSTVKCIQLWKKIRKKTRRKKGKITRTKTTEAVLNSVKCATLW